MDPPRLVLHQHYHPINEIDGEGQRNENSVRGHRPFRKLELPVMAYGRVHSRSGEEHSSYFWPEATVGPDVDLEFRISELSDHKLLLFGLTYEFG